MNINNQNHVNNKIIDGNCAAAECSAHYVNGKYLSENHYNLCQYEFNYNYEFDNNMTKNDDFEHYDFNLDEYKSCE